MVTDTLTVAGLETRLNDVLDRVRRGEQIAIERDGEVIVTIVPPDSRPGIAWGQFVATYPERTRPYDRFTYDLKVILAERQVMSP